METDNIQAIKEALISFGASEEEVEKIIAEVNEVIKERFIMDYLNHLDQAEKESLIKVKDSELIKYLEDNKHSLPPGSEDRYSEIAQAVWQSYFEFMNNNK